MPAEDTEPQKCHHSTSLFLFLVFWLEYCFSEEGLISCWERCLLLPAHARGTALIWGGKYQCMNNISLHLYRFLYTRLRVRIAICGSWLPLELDMGMSSSIANISSRPIGNSPWIFFLSMDTGHVTHWKLMEQLPSRLECNQVQAVLVVIENTYRTKSCYDSWLWGLIFLVLDQCFFLW